MTDTADPEVVKAHALGYCPDTRPYADWQAAGLVCPWQHCVEINEITVRRDLAGSTHVEPERVAGIDGKTYPAHRVDKTRAGTQERRQRIAELASTGHTSDQIATLVGTMPLNRLASVCPVFGHDCPNGIGQAAACTAAEADS